MRRAKRSLSYLFGRLSKRRITEETDEEREKRRERWTLRMERATDEEAHLWENLSKMPPTGEWDE